MLGVGRHSTTLAFQKCRMAVVLESEVQTQLLQSQLEYAEAQDELNEAMGRSADRRGLKQAGFHSFRHGNETVMDGLQTPIALRLNRLGHGDIRMMTHYSHVIGADDRHLASEFGRMLAPISPAVLERFGADNENGLSASNA